MKYYISCLIFVLSVLSSVGATIPAASANLADVQAAYVASADGDTITIPAGTAAWTNHLDITKAITILGAGTNDTIIIDQKPNTLRTHVTLFRVGEKSTNFITRIGHMTLRGDTNFTLSSGGAIQFFNRQPGHRVDHITFDRVRARPMWMVDTGTNQQAGVIDSCWFDTVGGGLFYQTATGLQGHQSFVNPIPWGTTNLGWYMESCVATYVQSAGIRAISDGREGMMFCYRFNIFTNLSVENHEFGSSGKRAHRAIESYNNTFYTAITGESAHLIRSGTATIFSNTVAGSYPAMVRILAGRSTDPFNYYGQGNGTNVWDENAGVLYITGTNNSAVTNSVTLTDTTKVWTNDGLRSFSIQNKTTGKSGVINGNTANTLTTANPITAANKPLWSFGNVYEIYRMIRTLDAPGMGSSDPINSGNPPTPTTWPNQLDDPIYAWDNTGTTNIANGPYEQFVIAGRNYTNGVARPGYTPLIYPHPLVSGTNPPVVPAPSAPTGLTATAINPSQINLSWTNTATNAANIRIERSINDNLNFQQITFLDTNETSYADLALTADTTYYYRLRTSNSGGFSAYSNEANATTPSDAPEANISGRINFLLRRKQVP